MIICLCHNLSEDDIITEGTCTKAGTGCGSCKPYVEELLESSSKDSASINEHNACQV